MEITYREEFYRVSIKKLTIKKRNAYGTKQKRDQLPGRKFKFKF